MEFEICTFIQSSPEEVFVFLRDLHTLPLDPRSVVPVYDKVTPGPVGVGTRFREVVRVAPFYGMEILSEVTECEQDQCLAYEWRGPGMRGELSYRITATSAGTRLEQRQTLHPKGLLRIFGPVMGRAFYARIKDRLEGIKVELEGRRVSSGD